ncbi:hypothetical protein ACH42_04315 [Endozoicomonas sp. (ex Bugula neritina AB1)]|nr:hypothetical protein ACH42_04315 [Endozoicomonas sp. (ex Bugula neritina AB1)]
MEFNKALFKKALFQTALALTCSLTMSLQAAPVNTDSKQSETSTTEAAPLKQITWDELIPPVDPKFIERYQAGKISQDEISDYLEILGKKPVTALDGAYTKMPGYLVPLNMNEKQIATELLLVPSAGSCIHVPPPPPNQTIYVKYDKGIKVEDAGYTPYWVKGKFKVETKSSKYTDALYIIEVDEIIEWE